MSEYEIEPVKGLPEPLPEGESILWQSEPVWESVARRAFHIRGATIYFAALLAWCLLPFMEGREDLSRSATHAFALSILGAVALALLALFAWLVAKTTVYTVTNKRVVIRCGIALPIVLNLPYKLIQAAAFKPHGDGTGDIVLSLAPSEKLSYVMLWPHVRPWRFKLSEPMLRGVKDAAAGAQILARALAAASGQPAQAMPEAVWGETTAARPPAAAAA